MFRFDVLDVCNEIGIKVPAEIGILGVNNDPISAITAACGWNNPSPPKILFKRRFGISMRTYRTSRSIKSLRFNGHIRHKTIWKSPRD